MKKSKYLALLCAVIFVITALAVPASAALSIEEQMAANSAAWHIANAAGDTATCEALHAANIALANSIANSGSAAFDFDSGTWNIATSTGSTINSSSSANGKSNTASYATTTSGGQTTYTAVDSYSDSAISSYKENGGTNAGLQTAYNNDAYNSSYTDNYGDRQAVSTASNEVAVAKALLGLTNSQAQKLQVELEESKNAYVTAKDAYEAAVLSGDAEAAEAAKADMDAAHNKAQETRASYGYSGDATVYKDGGYYYSNGKPVTVSGGGFYTGSITRSYNITASCNEGGTISPNGAVAVKQGDSREFVIRANEGYKVKSVTVDSRNKGALESYTFDSVTAAHTITVVFEKNAFTISASSGNGGRISPTGSAKLAYGDSKTFIITPNNGYKVDKVVVDGVSVGAVTSYTFADIKSAHTIYASFIPSGTVKVGTVELTDQLGWNINSGASGSSIKSGYGIFAEVPVSYEGISNLKVIMTYDFGSGSKSVTLQQTETGVFEFPINTASTNRSRCVYIPAATEDGTYMLTFTATAKNAAGEILTETSNVKVIVRGSMFEDDYTGDA